MALASTKGVHAGWSHRRQAGTLGEGDVCDGLRVLIEWEDDEPGEVRDVVAAVVVDDEWVFETSLVPRDEAGDPIRGALRSGDLSHRRLWPDPPPETPEARRAAVRDVQDAGLARVERARAQRRREEPTSRQVREAKRRLHHDAVRAVLEPILTWPDVGALIFGAWGRQLGAWDLAAGPLARQGLKRAGSHHPAGDSPDPGRSNRVVTRQTGAQLVRSKSAARRSARDRVRALPTEPVRGRVLGSDEPS